MREPAVAVALLQLFCRDEALVGDILEEFEARRSRAWLWRQVGAAVIFGLPYGVGRRERTSGKMPMPIGGIGLVAVIALVTIVAPGAWWLLAVGAAGGLAFGFVLVTITNRRKARESGVRRNVILPVLALLAVGAAARTAAGQALKPAVPIDPVDGIVEAFKTHQAVMLPGGHGGKRGHELLLRGSPSAASTTS